MAGRATVRGRRSLALAALAGWLLAAAASVSVNDTSHLRLVKASGSVLLEEGAASGTLPGHARVSLNVGASVSATFSIRTGAGTIYGRGGARLHSSARYASFGGWLSVTDGSGRYAHAHGSGWLYGLIDRRTHAVTVRAIGKLRD